MSQKLTQPNTTQVPHDIIREWMPRLNEYEFKILVLITDQTLGWGKDKDWLSHDQIREKVKCKIGKKSKKIIASSRTVTRALKKLVDEIRLIEAIDETGSLLDSAEKRLNNGGKIFYRLSLHKPQKSLFETRG